MIVYVSKTQRAILPFFEDWRPELRGRFHLLTYAELAERDSLPRGTVVFADLEQLDARTTEMAARIAERVAKDGVRVLNHPRRTVRRTELLRALEEAGVNAFRARPLVGCRRPPMFPVFIRHARLHNGSLTPLLHDQDELDRAAARLLVEAPARGLRLRDLLVVEFCDTSDDAGVFRKYAAFVVGDRLIPRQLFFSREWVVKLPGRAITPARVEEEREYVRCFPHEAALRDVARIARLGYGRIDYGVRDGRVQVWEANTHPVIIPPRRRVHEDRIELSEVFAERYAEAFAPMAGEGGPPIPLGEARPRGVPPDARRRRGAMPRWLLRTPMGLRRPLLVAAKAMAGLAVLLRRPLLWTLHRRSPPSRGTARPPVDG